MSDPALPQGVQRVLKIIVISDYICAFCYIGNKVLYDAIEACRDLPVRFDVEFRPFALLCPTSPNVDRKPSRKEYLFKKFGQEQAEAKLKVVYEMAQKAGLEMPNLAHRLAVKAYHVGGQDMQREFNDIIFKAAFADGRDISDPDFLVDTAARVGLMNREKASEFLRSTECQDCVDKMIDAAKANDVKGVPFIIIDGKWALNGVQPKECYIQASLPFQLLEYLPQIGTTTRAPDTSGNTTIVQRLQTPGQLAPSSRTMTSFLLCLLVFLLFA
ncbi:thioredoxin-like protein [Pisolithus orientalis]|uniref:thioredoxin-like protein n=1 Tax=Pisolithus orientalis TaxID=936130 RepID=UPI002223F9F8|nr:thioredoxin-like protein [Pisolithus orientalis]KAI6025574.1 thioredoxin-like protein [Pisolithus orientalis]